MKISRKPTPPPRPAAPSRFIQPFVWTKTADQILTKANRKQLQLRSTRGRSRTPRPDGATIGGPQFDGILDLLQTGENIEPTEDKRSRVVQRGLDKKAPFHRSRNSVADAQPIDICLRLSQALTLRRSNASFVTSNSDDSLVSGSHLVQPIGVA